MIRARLNGGIDPVDGTTEALWRERLGDRLAAQMALKPAYSMRFIGVADNNREILRVDRSGPNDAVRIVPEAELNRVGDAPYFRDTIRLRRGSSLCLAGPFARSKRRHRRHRRSPILQVATPVMTSDGKPYGIVIIDVDMRPALDRVRSSVRPGESAYLVDRKGDYLIHPDRPREFGSQRGKPDRLAARHALFREPGRHNEKPRAPTRIEDGQSGGAAFAPVVLAGSEWVAFIQSRPEGGLHGAGGGNPDTARLPSA